MGIPESLDSPTSIQYTLIKCHFPFVFLFRSSPTISMQNNKRHRVFRKNVENLTRLMLQRYMGARMTIGAPLNAPFGALIFTCRSWCSKYNHGEDPGRMILRISRGRSSQVLKLGIGHLTFMDGNLQNGYIISLSIGLRMAIQPNTHLRYPPEIRSYERLMKTIGFP